MAPGLPLQDQCAQAAGDAGHRSREVPDGHIRERLLLARAQGMPQVHGPQEQRRVLEGEGRPQSGARPAQQPAARIHCMERHHRMGMRTRQGPSAGHGQPHRSRTCGKQGQVGNIQPAPPAGPPVRP